MNGNYLPVGWQDRAVCAEIDPDLWFSTNTDTAKRVCRTCPVQLHCLDYALHWMMAQSDSDVPMPLRGVWGGMSELQRRRMIKDEAGSLS